MSTITNTVRNLRKHKIAPAYNYRIGTGPLPPDPYIGDNNVGTVGTNRFGNKLNPAGAPGSPTPNKPRTGDPLICFQKRQWEDTEANTIPIYTVSRAA
ncbi:hypothetical protein DL766_001112 [Monosporascus sp. MC13-8B]|uniref:Uncharacterized protein n=1 Tax=Monosporascus cannonballus TaxID=155416 RepID=A0ABY0HAE9_9PEZI|nr:hypothetical protein DL762_004531 [Monosporascus cannonballus]RYO90534.1 hypothetical protein DL763_005299 [Monosporascus cannonballus]RYP38202.1 hypothetical protein DL766_001112 [Monosporascus sp. MC13-8B]